MKPGTELARQDDRAKWYSFSGKNGAGAFDATIICAFLVYERMGNVLSDLGSTYSYVFKRFSSEFDMNFES